MKLLKRKTIALGLALPFSAYVAGCAASQPSVQQSPIEAPTGTHNAAPANIPEKTVIRGQNPMVTTTTTLVSNDDSGEWNVVREDLIQGVGQTTRSPRTVTLSEQPALARDDLMEKVRRRVLELGADSSHEVPQTHSDSLAPKETPILASEASIIVASHDATSDGWRPATSKMTRPTGFTPTKSKNRPRTPSVETPAGHTRIPVLAMTEFPSPFSHAPELVTSPPDQASVQTGMIDDTSARLEPAVPTDQRTFTHPIPPAPAPPVERLTHAETKSAGSVPVNTQFSQLPYPVIAPQEPVPVPTEESIETLPRTRAPSAASRLPPPKTEVPNRRLSRIRGLFRRWTALANWNRG